MFALFGNRRRRKTLFDHQSALRVTPWAPDGEARRELTIFIVAGVGTILGACGACTFILIAFGG